MAIPAVALGIISLADKMLDLGDQFIEDKDKRAEYANEIAKMSMQFSTDILKITTTPKVDAAVKILYALRDVAIPLFRPVGSAIMTLIGAWLTYKQVDMPEVVQATLIGALPAWGVSRHVNKTAEVKADLTKHTLSEQRKAAGKKEDFDFDLMGGD